MHIQQHVKTMAVSLTLCLAFGTILNAQDNRPNIVFILSDDQAWSDYGFMGHADIKTPHLDTLASSSLFFDRGYVAAPICRPSLASLVTGLFPHQLSCLPLTKPLVCLQPYDQYNLHLQ